MTTASTKISINRGMVLFRHANDVLKNETTMFEKYLKRVDPKDIGLQQASKL